MPKVAVVTDSTACIPTKLVKEYNIRVVPLHFIFREIKYTDDDHLPQDEFYRLLKDSPHSPTTSPASPGDYLEVFKELSSQVQGVLCLTVTSKISGMFDAARVAKETARETIPDVEIRVMDSGTAAMAQGFIALAAARVAQRGASLPEACTAAERLKARVNLIAIVDTLDYLAKSRRIPKVGAWAASLLGLKPILSFSNGAVKLLSAATNKPKAVERIIKIMEKRTAGRGDIHASIFHTNVLQEAEELKRRLEPQFPWAELFISSFTPAMGIYTGPGVLGLVFYVEEG